MFLLLGTRALRSIINVVSFRCAHCGVMAEQHVVKKSNRLTLFFVPLFSISTTYINECSNCGVMTQLTAAQARHSQEWAQAHKPAR